MVPWQGIAMVIRDKYKPEYKSIKNFGGNHVFKMPVTSDLSFEYMLLGAWSHGEVNKDEKTFVKYVDDEAVKYNNPPVIKVFEFETKSK